MVLGTRDIAVHEENPRIGRLPCARLATTECLQCSAGRLPSIANHRHRELPVGEPGFWVTRSGRLI